MGPLAPRAACRDRFMQGREREGEKEKGKQIRDSELFTRRLFHFSSAFSERTADPEKTSHASSPLGTIDSKPKEATVS